MIAQTFTPTVSSSSLAPTVFSILDSRIQFLEYQIKVQFNPQNQPVKNQLTAYEQLMNFYHKTCEALKLLQTLKEWVCEKNASIILDLLQDDAYLMYSENQLEDMIQTKEYFFH